MSTNEVHTILHWGKYVSSDKPVTGVLSVNSANWEFIDNEVCLTCESMYAEIESMDDCPECESRLTDDLLECPECGWNKEHELEFVECDSSHDKIIGDWVKDDQGLYIPDESGEFAAIVRESVIQVVWSKTLAHNKALCSPCYPGQVDLDSDGDFTGYTLPKELLYKD